jgi:1-acyl-sn-glycerol-3-phosphate acyltransferase
MILRAKHHPLIYAFFKAYSEWIIKRNFRAIQIIGEYKDSDLPIVLISNHISWWDGFWALHLNQKLLKRRFYFMMLEKQLRKYWYFNYTGGYSIKKKSKSIIETIEYSRNLLADKGNMILIFPQGEIQSMYTQSFSFEKGIGRVLHNLENSVQLIFLANFIDYFSNPKPSLYSYIQELVSWKSDRDYISAKYNEFYNDCLIKQKSLHV